MPNETTIISAGMFDPDAKYVFRLVIYERGISLPTKGATKAYIKSSRKYSQFNYTVWSMACLLHIYSRCVREIQDVEKGIQG